jgi:hypothetical protein
MFVGVLIMYHVNTVRIERMKYNYGSPIPTPSVQILIKKRVTLAYMKARRSVRCSIFK